MREDVRRQKSRLLLVGTKGLGSFGDRAQGQFKRRIEDLIAFLAEAAGLHAAAKQVKAEIEVSGIVCVISKECHGGCPEPIRRRSGARRCASDGLSKIAERFLKNLCVYRFLGFEVKVEGCGRVASCCRDCPQ